MALNGTVCLLQGDLGYCHCVCYILPLEGGGQPKQTPCEMVLNRAEPNWLFWLLDFFQISQGLLMWIITKELFFK